MDLFLLNLIAETKKMRLKVRFHWKRDHFLNSGLPEIFLFHLIISVFLFKIFCILKTKWILWLGFVTLCSMTKRGAMVQWYLASKIIQNIFVLWFLSRLWFILVFEFIGRNVSFKGVRISFVVRADGNFYASRNL